MALKTYIGARYAPKFTGEWNKNTAYEPLSVVYWNNNSYVSKKDVPAGTPVTVAESDGEIVTNSAYWILSSEWNAQVAKYQAEVEKYRDEAVKQTEATNKYREDTQNFFEVTMHSYNTEDEMKIDSTVKVGYTLVTCGKKSIGDGGGRYFKVVSETSSDAIALAGGLWAKPFNITLPEEDYTPLNVTLGDEDSVITISNMASGGRYITNNIGLQDFPQYAVSIPNAGNLNNVQLILIFSRVAGKNLSLQFTPALGSLTINNGMTDFAVRVKIDDGHMTVSASEMNYLTENDKNDIEAAYKKADTAIQSEFNTYKNSNDTAVSEKLNTTTFENYRTSNNSAVSAKLNSTTFNNYKNGVATNQSIRYTKNELTQSLYYLSVPTSHYNDINCSFDIGSATKMSVAKIIARFSPSDPGEYSGVIHIPVAPSNLTLLNKNASISFESNGTNSLNIDCAAKHTIGYHGIVASTSAGTKSISLTLFELDANPIDDEEFTEFKSEMHNRLDKKLDNSTFETYETSNNTAVSAKLDTATYIQSKTITDQEIHDLQSALKCRVYNGVTGTTNSDGEGTYTLDYRDIFKNSCNNVGVTLATETLSLTLYNFNIEFNCPTTSVAQIPQTITVYVPKKTAGLSSAGISGKITVTMHRDDVAQLVKREFTIELTKRDTVFKVTFIPAEYPSKSIVLFTSDEYTTG